MRKAFASARSGAGRLIEVVGDSGIGKTRLLEALRDAAAGLNKQHATCEAYTASAPYAVWSELLREYMKFGREDPEMVIAERLREEVAKSAPDLAPWWPLIAIAFGLEVAPTPEVEMLAQANRRAKVHESVARFLAVMMPKPQLIEIENAHHMDEASAELLSYLLGEIGTHPWLFAVARQGSKRVRGARGGDRGSHRAEAARSAGCAAARAARDPADSGGRACARGRGHALRWQSPVPARLVAEGGRLRRHRGPARFR